MTRFFLGALLLLPTLAISSTTPLDNFVLLDQNGKAQELYYQADARLLALVAHGSQCDAANPAFSALAASEATMASLGARVLLINSERDTSRAALRKSARAQRVTAPILADTTQLVGASLGFKSTGEAMLVDTNTWSVTWRGQVGDLAQAIESQVAGKAPPAPTFAATACAIDFEPVDTTVTYTADVAPILQENCAVCHTTGGIAPWAMTSYDMVKGFAPMIREVLRTKRMPPWHADPESGSFQHDRTLSRTELRTLISWAENGSPRGEGDDPLAAAPVAYQEWPLGKPDLIIDLPAFTLPATGVVDYQFPRVANPLDKAVWVRAATIVPGDRSAVHHILMGASEPGVPVAEGRENVFDNYIIGYAPGNESAEMPKGTGVYVQPGTEFLFQTHYTPYGKVATDRSRVGLYFAKDNAKPANYLRNAVVINPTLSIPPNNDAFAVSAYIEFDKPATIFSLVPHAHYRGKASQFELLHPDGRRELVLSVPNYDFNWQRTYAFNTPLDVEAGSRLIHTTTYDNSSRNTRNPDPNRTVPWGLQSHDEMLYGNVSYSWRNETSDQPIHDKGLADTYQWVGFLDHDMDGRLSWKELPQGMKKRLVQGFKMVDTNNDGGLDAVELYEINKRAAQQQASASR